MPQPVFAPPQVKPRAACACRLADCAHPLALFCPTHPPSKIASHPPGFAADWRGSGAGLQPKLKSPNMRGSAAGTRRKTTTTITPREREKERKRAAGLAGLPGGEPLSSSSQTPASCAARRKGLGPQGCSGSLHSQLLPYGNTCRQRRASARLRPASGEATGRVRLQTCRLRAPPCFMLPHAHQERERERKRAAGLAGLPGGSR